MEITSVKMVIQLEDKTEIERLVSIINLGICAAIESSALSIEDAESYLYSPYTIKHLEKQGVTQELIDVVHLGTELEYIKSLLTEKLTDSIDEIKVETIKLLKSRHSASPTSFQKKMVLDVSS